MGTGKAARSWLLWASGVLGALTRKGPLLYQPLPRPLSDLFRDLGIQLGIKLGRGGPLLLPELALSKDSGVNS